MGGSWEEVMSWVMADKVGQSEHHYSADFFFLFPLTVDYFSTAARHFAELFTRLSVGMWSQATFDAQENLNEGDRLRRPQHEHIMSPFWLDALLPL